MNRSEQLLNLREKITFQEDKTKSSIEFFQHKTLRPILKFLNETLNKISLNYIINLNPDFLHLNQLEQEKRILSTLKKEQILKNKLLGIVIGLFTQEEIDFYLKNNLKVDERIQQMLQERIRTQYMNFHSNNRPLSD
jgi:cellulose biosynthesis protein BcsQ